MSRPSARTSSHAPINFSRPSTTIRTSDDSGVTMPSDRLYLPSAQESKHPATTALMIQMPALTNSLPSSEPSTHSELCQTEPTYLRRVKFLSRLRLVVTLLLLGTAATILACEAHTLSFYNDTHLPEIFHLPLWPEYLRLQPTMAAIAVGSTITLICLVYVILTLVPSPHSKDTLAPLLFRILSHISLYTSVFLLTFTSYTHYHPTTHTEVGTNNTLLATVQFKNSNSNAKTGTTTTVSSTTLRQYTCTFVQRANKYNQNRTSSSVSVSSASSIPAPLQSQPQPHSLFTAPIPPGFKTVCSSTTASWGLSVGLLVLSLIAVALTVYARKMDRKRGEVSWVGDGENGGRCGNTHIVEKGLGVQMAPTAADSGMMDLNGKRPGIVSRMSW